MPVPSPWRSIEPTFSGRKGTVFQAGGPREYTRRFRVETVDKRLSSIAVSLAPGIPLPYSFYQSEDGIEFDELSLCVRISATQEAPENDDWSVWTVECDYSTEMPAGGFPDNYGRGGQTGTGTGDGPQSGGAANNPELEPPDIEWDYEIKNKPRQRDLDGKAFVNSAHQTFLPPPTFEDCNPVLVYTRNELGFNRTVASKYCFVVNSDTFLGAPPGTCLCLPPKAKMIFKGPYQYFRTTYRLKFGATKDDGTLETWQPQILDQGLCELQTVVGRPNFNKPVPIAPNGIPITQPVLLDGNGRRATPITLFGGVIAPPTPRYKTFRVYRAMSFSNLFNRGLGGP